MQRTWTKEKIKIIKMEIKFTKLDVSRISEYTWIRKSHINSDDSVIYIIQNMILLYTVELINNAAQTE